MLVLCQSQSFGDEADMGTPSGGDWIPLISVPWPYSSTTFGVKFWYKIAGASEPASYTITQHSGAAGTTSITCISGAGSNPPTIASTGYTTAGATTAPTPSTIPATGNDFEMRVVVISDNIAGAGTWSPPAGFTERADFFSQAQYCVQTVATRDLTSSAATGVQTFIMSKAFDWGLGFTLNIAPPLPKFIGWGLSLR